MAQETEQQTVVPDYWCAINKAGDVLHAVYGPTESEAREHAKRSLKVRKCKANEGTFGLRQMTGDEYRKYVLDENDS